MGCLHDPANVQQTFSKSPAIHVYFEYICWKFAGRLLDRVNILLLKPQYTRLQSCVINKRRRNLCDLSVVYVCLEWYKLTQSSSAVSSIYQRFCIDRWLSPCLRFCLYALHSQLSLSVTYERIKRDAVLVSIQRIAQLWCSLSTPINKHYGLYFKMSIYFSQTRSCSYFLFNQFIVQKLF